MPFLKHFSIPNKIIIQYPKLLVLVLWLVILPISALPPQTKDILK